MIDSNDICANAASVTNAWRSESVVYRLLAWALDEHRSEAEKRFHRAAGTIYPMAYSQLMYYSKNGELGYVNTTNYFTVKFRLKI